MRKDLPELGLVCITFSDAVRYRALTRKRLLQFEAGEQLAMLRDLYRDNLARFDKAIDFCQRHDIKLYRLTSAFFPFADTEIGKRVLEEMTEDVGRVGARAMESGLRVVLHPDQFCVLSSDSPSVIENSILILSTHAWIFDLLGLPRSICRAHQEVDCLSEPPAVAGGCPCDVNRPLPQAVADPDSPRNRYLGVFCI